MHHEGDVLVGDAFQGDQGFGRLQLAVEGHDLELLAEHAAFGVDAIEQDLEDLEELIPARSKRAGEGIDISDLDRIGGNGWLRTERGHGQRGRGEEAAQNGRHSPSRGNLVVENSRQRRKGESMRATTG